MVCLDRIGTSSESLRAFSDQLVLDLFPIGEQIWLDKTPAPVSQMSDVLTPEYRCGA